MKSFLTTVATIFIILTMTKSSPIMDSRNNAIGTLIEARYPGPDAGRGSRPPTVSEPGIHYTATVDARAFLRPETCVFIAYSATYTKRILHPFGLGDGKSFLTKRPLYVDDSLAPVGQASILETIIKHFSAEDKVGFHLMHPRESMTNSQQLKAVQAALQELSNSRELPFTPATVRFAWIPQVESKRPAGVPPMLTLTSKPVDQRKMMPVQIDDHSIAI